MNCNRGGLCTVNGLWSGAVSDHRYRWKLRLIEAGATVIAAAPEAGKVYTGKHGYPCTGDAAIEAVKESDFTGLILPGGFAPDKPAIPNSD
jgi:hypothetical protein